MADTMSIGRTTQFGVETTSGTGVPGTKLLSDLTVAVDPVFGITEVRGTGRRFDASVNPDGQERVTGKVGGGLGYNSIVYPMSMIWGASATVVHPAGGINAYQWQWIPALSGSIAPKSMTVEQGDANDAEQVVYTILTDLGIDFTRAAVTPSGNLLGRALNKLVAQGGTFTGMAGSPTTIAIAPVLPMHWEVHMNDIATSLGTADLLTRCFHAGLTYAGAYLPFFAINPAIASFAGLADNAAVQSTALLELMKDAVGEGLWTKARAGQRKYIRLKATSNPAAIPGGQLADNNWSLTPGATYVSGNWTISWKGVASANIAFGALGSAIQSAILAIAGVPAGSVTVTPAATAFSVGTGTTFNIALSGALQNDAGLFTVQVGTLSPATIPTLVAAPIPYSITIDFCGTIKMPGPMADNQGLRTRQWDFILTEDPLWLTGQALNVTVVNTLSAL